MRNRTTAHGVLYTPTLHAAETCPLRLVVVAPGELDRRALGALLRSREGFDVVAEVGSPADVPGPGAAASSADVLIVSLAEVGSESAPAIRALHDRCPEAPILVLLSRSPAFQSTSVVAAAIGADPSDRYPWLDAFSIAILEGAQSVLGPDATSEQLFRTVRDLGRGNHRLDDIAMSRLVSWARASFERLRRTFLSPCERQVARGLVAGLSNKEIADRLELSESTVKKHIGRMLRRTRLADRLQLGLHLDRNPYLLEGEPAPISRPNRGEAGGPARPGLQSLRHVSPMNRNRPRVRKGP